MNELNDGWETLQLLMRRRGGEMDVVVVGVGLY
jgi:hypothetical protein